MKLKSLFSTLLFIVLGITLFAQDTTQASSSSGGSTDWFSIIIATSYIVGIFILLPIVIYTNIKSKLYKPGEDDEEFQPIRNLDEEKRNARAEEILIEIENRLTQFTDENGEEMITITKGKQAKFMKKGLDYINKHLKPTDEAIIQRLKEFEDIYKIRTKRVFTGSKWIIGAAVGVGILMIVTGGISTFIFIHSLGIVFYILSSRTPMYAMEKRRYKFAKMGTGAIGGIMTALALGDGTKYYVSTNGGPYQRDWETEGSMAMAGLLILVFVALILGFVAAFLGVLNFIFNYSNSFLLPFNKTVDWYEENFQMQNA